MLIGSKFHNYRDMTLNCILNAYRFLIVALSYLNDIENSIRAYEQAITAKMLAINHINRYYYICGYSYYTVSVSHTIQG